MRTRDKLAAELRKVAAVASRTNADKYEAFAKRALTGEFDDFSDAHVCPITQLHSELMAAGFTQFAKRVGEGEFDATREEAHEWADTPAGRMALTALHSGVTSTKAKLAAQEMTMEPLGDGPVEPQYVDMMKEVARLIDVMFNSNAKGDEKTVGFVLLVFPFHSHEGRCNYMSNAHREDVVILLKEQLKRFEGQADIVGHA